jgi:hypothetical protein
MSGAVTTDRHYRQVLSTALALRAPGIEDLVSNSNPVYAAIKRKNLMKSYSGPKSARPFRSTRRRLSGSKDTIS